MDQTTVAKILFAETKNLQPAASAPTALSNARAALATAVIAANGVGYAPPAEPSAIELADVDKLKAWRDCLRAAQSPAGTVVGPICVIDDQLLTVTKSIPALQTVAAAGTLSYLGPFVGSDGKECYLQFFAGQPGVDPGRYPRGSNPVVAPPKTDRPAAPGRGGTGHGYKLGLILLGLAVALGLVGGWAYNKGVDLWNDQNHQRANWASISNQASITKQLKKAIDDTGAVPAAAQQSVGREVTQAVTYAIVRSVNAQRAVNDAKEAATNALGFKTLTLTDEERSRLKGVVPTVVASTVASDPLFKPVEADLTMPWVLTGVLIALMIGVVGWFIRRTPLGALIDNRNRLSLSLFQVAGWTILIFGLFYVTSLFLIGVWPDNNIQLPVYDSGMWALLGISIGSASISQIIRKTKDDTATSTAGAGSPADGQATSLLEKRDNPSDWSLYDLFLGEELTNFQTVDLTRAQQLLITIVLMIVFAAMAGTLISSIGWPVGSWSDWAKQAIPKLSDDKTFLGLLAASHGGYLLFKTLPKTAGVDSSGDGAGGGTGGGATGPAGTAGK